MILTSFDFRSTQGWPRAFWLIWPEMVLWLLQCLNWLHHVNLNVSMTPWKEVNIFEIFGVWHKIKGGQYGIYSSHYMHLSLMTFLQALYFFYIYHDDVCFSPLPHMCCFFSFFIHMFLSLYNLSIFHTWCLDGSCLSVSTKTGCSLSCHDLSSCKDFQEFFVDRPRMYWLLW